jgi:hypothetical protein
MRFKALLIIPLLLFLSACSNWEQQTYKTLASAKATIDCATAGYNHNDAQITQYCTGVTVSSTYLPQTMQIDSILVKAGQAKDVAVNAMIAYEEAKAAKNSTDLTTMQTNVNAAVVALSADIVEITQLAKGGK